MVEAGTNRSLARFLLITLPDSSRYSNPAELYRLNLSRPLANKQGSGKKTRDNKVASSTKPDLNELKVYDLL